MPNAHRFLSTLCCAPIGLLAPHAQTLTATVSVGTMPFRIAVNTVTNRIYVANQVSNSVTILDGNTNSAATVAVGSLPSDLGVNPVTNKIYVSNPSSNNVTVIDGVSNSTTTVAAGTYPYSIAVNSVTDKIYVANISSNNVTVIDGATNSTTTVSAGTNPSWVAVNPVTNKIYVSNYASDNVTVIDGTTNSTTTVSAGTQPDSVAVNSVTNKIYVVNGASANVTVIDGASNSSTNVDVGAAPLEIAVNATSNKVYVADQVSAEVTVIDGETNSTKTVGVGGNRGGVAVNPTTNKIYVANRTPRGAFALTMIDGATNSTAAIELGTVSALVDSEGVAVNSATNKVYVINQMENTVAVIDGTLLENGASFTAGALAPESIASAFGSGLATTAGPATTAPPPLTLNGATVSVQDAAGTSRAASLFYASPTQVNFEIPAGTVSGSATVTISSAGTTYGGPVQIANVAPGVFTLDSQNLCAAQALLVHADGTQSFETVYQADAAGNVTALPIGFGAASDQLYLTLFATGVRNATNVAVTVAGTSVPVLFAGAQGGFVGVDQINVGPLPRSLAVAGIVNIMLVADGVTANVTSLTFQ